VVGRGGRQGSMAFAVVFTRVWKSDLWRYHSGIYDGIRVSIRVDVELCI